MTILLVGVALLAPMPAAQALDDAREAVIRSMTSGQGDDYFKYFCVAVAPGTLPTPATRETRILSTQSRTDPPVPFRTRLTQLSRRIVAASECDSQGEDVVHRATKKKPALLIVLGPVELVADDRVRVTVFTTSGFLTETHTLLELVRRGLEWQVASEQILLQA